MIASRRSVVPHLPPTGVERHRFIVRLIVVVTGLQFGLGGLGCLLGAYTTLAVWWIAGFIVVVATLQIENFFLRKHDRGS